MAAREEDKAMAGLLRRSLARNVAAGSGSGSGEDCPGPEILAAYFDQALDAQETARYDLHFSRCSLCREQLAAMARAGAASEAKDAEKKNASAWDWLMGPRWLMPAAAMLVALLAIAGIAWRIWRPVAPANEIARAQPDSVPGPNSVPAPSSELRVNPALPTNSVPTPQVAPPAKSAPLGATGNSVVPRAAPTPGDSASVAMEPGERRRSRTYGATSAGGAKAGASHANTAARREALSSGGGTGNANYATRLEAAPPPQTMSRMKSPEMDRGAMRAGNGSGVSAGTANSADATANGTESVQAQDAAVAPATPPAKKAEAGSVESDSSVVVPSDEAKESNAPKTKQPPPAAPSQAVGAMNRSAGKMSEAAALAKLQAAQISSNLMNLQIPTPDAKILWMLASPGVIEKSEDGGATWKPEYLETRALILAGAAPTAQICWLVGVNGIILRTTNGAHWKTIRPPVGADFVRVEAEDGLTATVTATDGRKFATVDGGKSWSGVK
jgi:hypothetical protein